MIPTKHTSEQRSRVEVATYKQISSQKTLDGQSNQREAGYE